MRHAFVIFIAVLFLGTILYFRQNPQAAGQVQEKVQEAAANVEAPPIVDPYKDLLLPDMKIVPPKELYIARPSSTTKVIRFSTTFANIGKGPLELIGHHDPNQEKTFATQYIKKTDGTGFYQEVGEFVLHPAHDHWHIGNYVHYELWSIKGKNEKDELLGTTSKQSFCIWDENIFDLTLPNSAKTRFYSSACSRNTQGMSIGWSDTYLSRVEGQNLDITNILDGAYILWFEINPDRRILESNYDNNADWLKIEITGNRLSVLDKK